jgi:AcrR family transcriptional regulator
LSGIAYKLYLYVSKNDHYLRPKDDIKLEKIYQATLKLTEHFGLAGITMARIAQVAGIATGSLYTYFPGKTELVQQTYQQTLKLYARNLFQGIPDEPTVRLAIKQIFANYLRFLQEHQAVWLFQDQYFLSSYAIANKASAASALEMLAPLVRLLHRGKQEQALKNIPDSYFLMLLLGLSHELAVAIKIGTHDFSEEMLETSFRLFWDAIRA